LKIVHVITKLDVGGAQSVVRELAIRQRELGHHVEIITGTLGPVAEFLGRHGIAVHHHEGLVHAIDPLQDRRAGVRLQGMLREFAPDLVHSHSSKTGLLGRRAARQLDLPSVYTAHGWPFQKGAPPKQRILSWLGETSAGRSGGHIVCVTSSDFSLAGRLRLAPESRVHLVPNGTGDKIVGRLNGPHGRDADSFTVLMVARFASPKRHDILVGALRLLPRRVRVVFVGDGPRMSAAKKRSNSLSDRVIFEGAGDPLYWLQRSNALVLASDYEGLPMSVLEGMRAGLPVVANDLPGIRDAVTDGVEGLLVEKTPIGFATALRSLTSNTKMALDLGEAAQQRWGVDFRADVMTDRYLKIYGQALS
jgi:glycosyltransferase involved in cell wall biosynthesis